MNKTVKVKVVQPQKQWYKSKTLWINVLAITGGVITALSGEMKAGGTITAVGFANLILRIISKSELK